MENLPNDSDGDVIRSILKNGSDLSLPMEIDFQIAAATLLTAQKAGEEAEKLGFLVAVTKDDGRDQYTCNCTKMMLLTYESVISTQSQLSEIAIPFGAYSDGWGTFGNKK